MTTDGQDQKHSPTQAARTHAERLKKTALHNPKEFIKRIILTFMAQKIEENPNLNTHERWELLLEGLKDLRDLSFGPRHQSFMSSEAKERYQQFETILSTLVESSEREAGNKILGQLQRYGIHDLCKAVFASSLRASKTAQALQAMGIEKGEFENFLNREAEASRASSEASQAGRLSAEGFLNQRAEASRVSSEVSQVGKHSADAAARAVTVDTKKLMGLLSSSSTPDNTSQIVELRSPSSAPVDTEEMNPSDDLVSEGLSSGRDFSNNENSLSETSQATTPSSETVTAKVLSAEEQQLKHLQDKANRGNAVAFVKYIALSFILDTAQELGQNTEEVTQRGWTFLLFECVRQLYGVIHPWEKQESELPDDQVEEILKRFDKDQKSVMVEKLASKSQKELYDAIFSAAGSSKTAEALKNQGVEEDQALAEKILNPGR